MEHVTIKLKLDYVMWGNDVISYAMWLFMFKAGLKGRYVGERGETIMVL